MCRRLDELEGSLMTISRVLTFYVIAILGIAIGLSNKEAQADSDLIISRVGGNPSGLNPDLIERFALPNPNASLAAYSASITICNLDNTPVSFNASNPSEHPAITQNLFRLTGGRLEQIGVSWVFHPPNVANFEECSNDEACTAPPNTDPDYFAYLYKGCSQSLSGTFVAAQSRLGPRSEIDPTTGVGPFPFFGIFQSGDNVYKRLQVLNGDLDPALHPDARYFIEVIGLNFEDDSAGSDINNVSFREVSITERMDGGFDLEAIGSTYVGQPVVAALPNIDSKFTVEQISHPGDGTYYLATYVENRNNGRWDYQYALYNFDSAQGAAAFEIPLGSNLIISAETFSDVGYHSGDGNMPGTDFDGTDWSLEFSPVAMKWETSDALVDPNANALRWATLYSFGFSANAGPTPILANIRSYSTPSVVLTLKAFGPGSAQPGACCFGDGSCTEELELQCSQTAGVFAGVGVSCVDAVCPANSDSRLTLEVASECPGDSNLSDPGDLVTVELWMRDVDQNVNGFQAFLSFDDSLLMYRPDLSSYSATPFGFHIASIADSDVASGAINLDGSTVIGMPPVMVDAHLATLVFEIQDGADCEATYVAFRSNLPFKSELSLDGEPTATLLQPTPELTFDDVAPDVVVGSIASCYPTDSAAMMAALNAVSAMDNCTTTNDLQYQASVSGDPCAAVVSILVMDACMNQTEVTFETRIDDEPPMLVQPNDDISLVAPSGECSAIAIFDSPVFSDNCDDSVTVTCNPPSGSAFPAGITVVDCFANDSCGNQTHNTFAVEVDAVRQRMELQIASAEDCYDDAELIRVDLVMTCLDQPVTGFNAFIAFDNDQLEFRPDLSVYTNDPFPTHISNPISASVVGTEGQINLDGALLPGQIPVLDDAILATMYFEVRSGMGGQVYEFDFRVPPTPTFESEYSINGSPIETVLVEATSPTPQPRLRIISTSETECFQPNDEFCVGLEMACLGNQLASGFNAFIEFDTDRLEFIDGQYTNDPFPIHITTIGDDSGLITLDGSVPFGANGTNQEALLATLCFRVRKDGFGPALEISFGDAPTPTIDSELSVAGVPIPTLLEGTGDLNSSTLGLRVCYTQGNPVCVLLEATCIEVPISGFKAVVQYNNDALSFLPMASSYEAGLIDQHMNDPISPISNGMIDTILLDGSTPMAEPIVFGDTTFARLCFDINPGFESFGPELIFDTSGSSDDNTLYAGIELVPVTLRPSPAFGLMGDINLDGLIDFADLQSFVDALLNIDLDEPRRLRSDLNCDGRTNGGDITEMIMLLL